MVEILKTCEIVKSSCGVRGQDYVAVWFTGGLGSEAITDPHRRGAPYRKERLLKCGKAFIKARQDLHTKGGEELTGSLGPGEVFLACDNQKPGNLSKFTDWLKDGAGKKSNLHLRKFMLVYDFDTLKARKFRQKGVGTLKQEETLLVVTHSLPLQVPAKQHTHYPGANGGSVIGPIKLQPYNKCWSISFDEKKAIYGRMRVAVGGTCPEDDDGDEDAEGDDNEVPPTVEESVAASKGPEAAASKMAKVRSGKNMEPMTYYNMPEEFYENTCDAFNIKDSVDFTPGDGMNAMAHIKACRKTPRGYIGICFTDSHKDDLWGHLCSRTLELFATSSSPLFHPQYAAGVKKHGEDAADIDDTPAMKQAKTDKKKDKDNDDDNKDNEKKKNKTPEKKKKDKKTPDKKKKKPKKAESNEPSEAESSSSSSDSGESR